MNKLDEFKNIADDMMKDIVVSEDLKKRTIEKCKREISSKRSFIVTPAAVAVASALALAVLNFNWFPMGREQVIDSPSTLMEAAGENSNGTDLYSTQPNDASLNPNDPVSSDSSALQAPAGASETSPVQSTEPYEGTGTPLYESGTLEAAKVYMGSKLKLPQYLPANYELNLVQVPADMSKKGMDVMISFEDRDRFFTITMRSGAFSLDGFVGSKVVDINGSSGEMTTGKLMADDIEIAPDYTQLRWISDDVLYILEGQISEEEAVKVARSIK
ncbi:DUF4367 domain-containing protein [Clostridium thermarum]|uniref:DUF4367 domain-containing protein n=1 Tax=Clostridium thermarum TaxID=1716543 RepID=UPI0013D2D2FC|nr:DUF4367 domain-containing protein [Clostridium thermarum]